MGQKLVLRFGIFFYYRLYIYINTANNIHPRIKLEIRSPKDTIEFLDTKIQISNGYIETDLYSKETDKHQYLHISSNHPRKTKESIPYGLGVRLKRICSIPTEYERRKNDLKEQLQKRGYKTELIIKQLNKVDNLDREDLLKYKTKKINDRVPLVLTYSDALPNIHSILHKHISTLHRSKNLKDIFPQPPLVAFRRDKNIKDILVHKKHNNKFYHKENKCEPCGKNCALCPYIVEDNSFKGKDGTKYQIQGHINCKTVGIIYAIFCKKM